MASKTPIKIVTNLDLSRNDILNVSKIEGNQKYDALPRNLEIASANIEKDNSGDVEIYTGTAGEGKTRGSVKILAGKDSTKGVEVKPDSTIDTTSDTNINLTASVGINNTVGNTTLKLSKTYIKANTTDTTVETNTLETTVKGSTTITSTSLNLKAGEEDKAVVINTGTTKSEIQSNKLIAKGTVETPEVVVNDQLIIYWDDKSNSVIFAKKA